MKFSTKIILGVLAFAALCLVYYSDNYFSEKKTEKKEELSKAIFFKPADVLKFSLKNKNGNFSFARENKTSEWKLFEPRQINADQDAVTSTILALSQIDVQQELVGTENIGKREKNLLSQFGLDDSKIAASVTLSNNKVLSLNIGNDIAIGSKIGGRLNSVSQYAFNPDRPLVLVVDASNSPLLQDKTFSDFRTKRVSVFKGKDVAAVSINSKAVNVSIEKKNEKWNIVGLKNVEADQSFISSFLQTYQSLVAQKIIEKEELIKQGKQKYGLQSPAASIKFLDAQGKLLQEFLLGITKEGIYVQMVDGAVAKLNLESWPDYVPLEAKFRNRLILLGVNASQITAIKMSDSLFYVKKNKDWYKLPSLTTPIKSSDKPSTEALSFFSNFELMVAEDLVSSPSSEELNKFGIHKPLKTFSFLFSESSKRPPLEIFVGNRVPLHEKNVYIKRSDLPSVYIVNADWLSRLAKL